MILGECKRIGISSLINLLYNPFNKVTADMSKIRLNLDMINNQINFFELVTTKYRYLK